MIARIHYQKYVGYDVPYIATDVLCSDGKRRTVRLAQQADTFFSIPGRVQVRGKTVPGFVMDVASVNGVERDLHFIANKRGKNGALLSGVPRDGTPESLA